VAPMTSSASIEASMSISLGGGWRKGSPVGRGSFSTVYAALSAEGVFFAVKETSISSACDKDLEKALVELDILKTLSHPNIIGCLGHQVVDGILQVFLELMGKGSVASTIKQYGPLTGNLLPMVTVQALQGLQYLHTRSPIVVHRDIKGANILIGRDLMEVKLADFGCSKLSDVSQSLTTVGSIPWMAPEVILQQSGYGRKADIWSLGCTVLEMATGETPWGRGAFDNFAFAILCISREGAVPPIPGDLEQSAQDFVALCTQREVDCRPSSSEALEHYFLVT